MPKGIEPSLVIPSWSRSAFFIYCKPCPLGYAYWLQYPDIRWGIAPFILTVYDFLFLLYNLIATRFFHSSSWHQLLSCILEDGVLQLFLDHQVKASSACSLAPWQSIIEKDHQVLTVVHLHFLWIKMFWFKIVNLLGIESVIFSHSFGVIYNTLHLKPYVCMLISWASKK